MKYNHIGKTGLKVSPDELESDIVAILDWYA